MRGEYTHQDSGPVNLACVGSKVGQSGVEIVEEGFGKWWQKLANFCGSAFQASVCNGVECVQVLHWSPSGRIHHDSGGSRCSRSFVLCCSDSQLWTGLVEGGCQRCNFDAGPRALPYSGRLLSNQCFADLLELLDRGVACDVAKTEVLLRSLSVAMPTSGHD